MGLQTKKFIKIKDMAFMKDNTSLINDLNMCSRERNEGLKVVVVDESCMNMSMRRGPNLVLVLINGSGGIHMPN